MSDSPRMPLAAAEREASSFRAMFLDYCQRWEIAGSVRRQTETVGDIEHVAIPAFGPATPDGAMFPDPNANLLLHAMDRAVADGKIAKAIYSDGHTRWGEKYRGAILRGVRHEVFLAEPDNWGAILTIRTGPAEFSKRLVTQLLDGRRLRQQGGFVRYEDGTIYPCRDEEAFFHVCGEPFVLPKERR